MQQELTDTLPSTKITTRSQALRQAWIFYCLAFSLACVALAMPNLLILYMFSPAIAAVVLLLISRDGGWKDSWRALALNRLGLRSWLPAILIPMITIGIGYIAVWSLGIAKPSVSFGDMHWFNSSIFILSMLVLNTCVFSLGEEIGWRGYLLPRLMVLGPARAYLLVGLGWALWHYPILFFSTAYYAEGNRYILTLLFTSTVIPISFIIGELRMRSQSVWVASLFHSSHNVIWGFLSSFTLPATYTAYIAGETGLIPFAIYTAVAVWMVQHRRAVLIRNAQAASSC